MALRKIIGVFDTQEAAQRARDGLIEAGLQREQISVVDRSSSEFSTQTADGRRAGFWAHMKEMFMPHEDRATLDESVRRGGYVLTASVEEGQADAAIDYLDSSGAVDLEERTAQWRAAGWQGAGVAEEPRTTVPSDRTAATAATPRAAATGTTAATATQAADDETIPVIEERLRVGKREVNRGSVRVRSYIVEEPVHEEVRLREEHVEVERHPVRATTGTATRAAPEELLREQTIELTETAEEAVVAKEAVVTEEVRVSRTSDERVEQIDDTVRRTKVEVDDTRTGGQRAESKDASARRPQTTPKSNPTRPGRM